VPPETGLSVPRHIAEIARRLEPPRLAGWNQNSVDYVTLANFANLGTPVMPNAQYWREQVKMLCRITRASQGRKRRISTQRLRLRLRNDPIASYHARSPETPPM